MDEQLALALAKNKEYNAKAKKLAPRSQVKIHCQNYFTSSINIS